MITISVEQTTVSHPEETQQNGFDTLAQEAIQLAIQGRWEEAVSVNRSIIDRSSNDVGAYNRLGRALTELGRYEEAVEAYSKALEISPGNSIASKNLARLKLLSQPSNRGQAKPHRVASHLFVTEMGKAGVVKIQNLASATAARLGVGARLRLEVQGRRLLVADEHGDYLGEVEPKHAVRLVRLIQGGNRYATALLRAGEDEAQAIIREEYQHPAQSATPSFPTLRGRPTRHMARERAAQDTQVDENYVPQEASYAGEEVEDEEKALLEGFSVLEDASDDGGS